MGLLLVALALGAAEGEWKTFAPKGGGFSISFPGTPTENKQETKTPAGTVTVTYFVAEQDGITYVASYSVYPKESVKPRTEEKRLDNARDGASAKGKLERERKFTFHKSPAREVLIQGEKSFVRSRIYAVENRLYQTLVTGTKQEVVGKEASRFLESFKLK